MDQKLVIGMDFGSDSVRAVLVDVKDGHEYVNAVCNYPRWMKGLYCDSSQDRYRQHARDYVEAMTEVLRQVIAACPDPRTIAAISVDTTASTPCLTDDKMVPLCLKPGYEEDLDAMFVLWKDHTGTKESAEIEALCAQSPVNYACHTGGDYSPENFWSKVLHLLRSSEKLRSDAYSVIELCDFIPAVLTGVSSLGQMRMSHCVAGAKWMWAEEWGGFPPEEFFRKLDPILLPVLRHLPSANYYCSEAFGHLSAEWAAKLGLSTDVLVGVGNVDSHSGAVGAGVAEGRMVMNLGTSACYMGVVPREKIGGKDIPGVFGQVDGMIRCLCLAAPPAFLGGSRQGGGDPPGPDRRSGKTPAAGGCPPCYGPFQRPPLPLLEWLPDRLPAGLEAFHVRAGTLLRHRGSHLLRHPCHPGPPDPVWGSDR